MSDSTRQAAKVKLAAFSEKIGYPDKWRDYAGVEVKHAAVLREPRRRARSSRSPASSTRSASRPSAASGA